MNILLNLSQKKALSNFFSNVAVAWFVALFITPSIRDIDPLTVLRFIANMVFALYLSLFLLKENYGR